MLIRALFLFNVGQRPLLTMMGSACRRLVRACSKYDLEKYGIGFVLQ
jgi:hypothetical protein